MQDCTLINKKKVGFKWLPINGEDLFNREKNNEASNKYPYVENASSLQWKDNATVTIMIDQGKTEQVKLHDFFNKRLGDLFNSCADTLGADIKRMISLITFTNPENKAFSFMLKNKKNPEILDKYYPHLSNVLTINPKVINYKNPTFTFSTTMETNLFKDPKHEQLKKLNMCPIKICKGCVSKIIYDNYYNRRCVNLLAIINAFNVISSSNLIEKDNNLNDPYTNLIAPPNIGPYLCDINNIYLSSNFCKISAEDRAKLVNQGKINEEHILPFSLLVRYEGLFYTFDENIELIKIIFRNLHPMATDIHNLYYTTKNINSARSNFKFSDVPKPNVYLKFNYDKPHNVDLISERLAPKKWKKPDNDSEWNKMNESGKREYFNKNMYEMDEKWGTNKYTSETLPIYDKCAEDLCKFEPLEEDKGKIARAMLYCYVIYALGFRDRFKLKELDEWFTADSIAMFLEWNDRFPTKNSEIIRNRMTDIMQNTINPFVYSEIVNHVFKGENPGKHLPDPKGVDELKKHILTNGNNSLV